MSHDFDAWIQSQPGAEDDGMVTKNHTKEELAGILNENGYVPV